MDHIKSNSSLFDAHRTSIRSTLLPPLAVRDVMELLLIKQKKRKNKLRLRKDGTQEVVVAPPPDY